MSEDRRSRLEARLQNRRDRAPLPALKTDGSLKLMLVDDEPPNLQALERLLRTSFDLTTYESGEAALCALEEGLVPDIVLSDQRMPGMKGVEFLGHVTDRCPLAMRLILSGYTERTDLLSAINSGDVDQYVTKPWEAAALLNTLQEAIDEHARRVEEHEKKLLEAGEAARAGALADERRRQVTAALVALLIAGIGLTWSLLRAPYDEDEYLLIARQAIDREWVSQIPDEALKMVNPEGMTDASVTIGKKTYESGCVGCHASDAKGGGPIAKLFTIPAGALYGEGGLTLPEGAFVWVVTNGIEGTAMKPMGSLVGDNFWHLANYLTSLAVAESGAGGALPSEAGGALPSAPVDSPAEGAGAG